MVDHASNDELFVSGHLRGHLTLAIAELESGDDHFAQVIYTTISQSLERAIGAGELSSRGQALVTDMWEHLFQQASQWQVVTPGALCLMRRLSRLIRSTGNAQVG